MMRKILLVLSLAFAIVMLPCVSLADDDGFSGSDGGEFYQNYGLRWSGYTHDGEWTAALAKAPDSWYAAVLACGGNPALLTPEVRSKLSDPSYGGAFYTYATTFYHIMSQYEIPEWIPLYVLTAEGLSDFWHGDFGDTWLWQSEVPNIVAAAALVDYNKVVKGEDLGGGGGSDEPADIVSSYVLDTLHGYYPNHSYSSWLSPSGSVTVTLSNPSAIDSQLQSIGCSYFYPVCCYYSYIGGGTFVYRQYIHFIASASPVSFNFSTDLTSSARPLTITCTSDSPIYDALYDGNPSSGSVVIQANPPSTFNASYTISSLRFSNEGNTYTIPKTISASKRTCNLNQAATISSAPVVAPPDGEWPEPAEPVTPDPPEVPTPTAPTETVGPDPTAPTITWPTAPTLVLPTAPIVVETPEGIDYTELLTLINDNLNSIDAYLQNFYTSFNSFRSDFLNGVDDIVDGLRNIYQYLGHLNNILEVHCKHITDQIEESVYNLELYLKRLFEWLPRQLDFDAQYDDSAVTALLRRILYKIPGGSTGTPITYKPNPQSDEPSFWDWLADLFNRILQKLLDLLPDEMIQLGQLFGELINLFPFSIPWDLFALLALFGHEPVTPVIDIPWGYGGSDGQVMMIRIDLHAWDGVAEMVRPVFLVLFCLQLALLSRDLLKIINVKSGGE